MSVFGFGSSKDNLSRPGTASLARPGTSNGRKNLTQSNSTSNQAPDISSETSAAIIQREIGNDDLLRILNSDRLHISNDVIILCEKGDIANLLKLHVKGLDIVSCRGLNGYTPLHHACNRGHALVVAELLRLNALIDHPSDSGETPLHLAVYAGNILIVDQLLDFGANVNAVNNEGETCLFYAARKAQPAIIRLLMQVSSINTTTKLWITRLTRTQSKLSNHTSATISSIPTATVAMGTLSVTVDRALQTAAIVAPILPLLSSHCSIQTYFACSHT